MQHQTKWMTNLSDASHARPVTPRPKRRQGTLYKCGWESGRLAQHLFDDFLEPPEHDANVTEYNGDKMMINDTTTLSDVLVFGGGECGRGKHLRWLQENFRGTILFVNGESHAGQGSTAERSFMISSQQQFPNNVYVPYAAMALVGMVSPHHWPMLWTMKDGHSRPRNKGKHFMVYANRNCVQYRNQVALALSHVGVIHHGDCCPDRKSDNFTQLPPAYQGHDKWGDNYKLFSQYRFCLVLENGKHPGYVTEKVLYALLGGCLPIWYGTTDVWNIFHKDSFIYVNVTDPVSIDKLVRQVRYLEDNQTAYDEFFQHSILANDSDSSILEQFFSLDDTIGNGRLKHEIRVMMGLEDDQYQQLTLNATSV
jgi:hypothetical protein